MSGDRREAVEAVVQAHLAGLIAALYSAPDAAMLTVAQVEAVSAYAARQHLALLDERDALAAKVAALTSALERTEANFVAAVNGRPVRDMTENLAENRAALRDQP